MSLAYEIDDDTYPFTAVTFIRSTWPNGQASTGTGFLVGENDVLTASHVVYNAARGGDAVTVEVIPSYDPDSFSNESFFASDWLRYTDFDPNFDGRLVSGDFQTITQEGAEKDIALLTVNGGIGKYGWFGIDYQQYTGTFQIENAGYPGVYGLQPMYDTGTVTGSSVDNVYYEVSGLDVNPGNSGGPIFYTASDGPYAIGLISTGSFYTSLAGHAFWLRDALRDNDADPVDPLPPGFNALEYIASYGDLMAAFGANPSAGVSHYLAAGSAEGRTITFDGLEYIASYGDLMAAFGANATAGAAHYITNGRFEGRGVSFDELEYIASYADLISAFGAAEDAGAAHYINQGRFEGRTVIFDELEYVASYDDLLFAFGTADDAGATHFINYGRAEGRAVSFDGLEYIASHADLIMAFGGNSDAGAAHFIDHGRYEGRTRDAFNAQQYLNNYADLSAAFGNDLDAAVLHFIQHGFYEGRTDMFVFG